MQLKRGPALAERGGRERGVLLSEAGLSGAHGADQWAWQCVVEGERSTLGCGLRGAKGGVGPRAARVGASPGEKKEWAAGESGWAVERGRGKPGWATLG